MAGKPFLGRGLAYPLQLGPDGDFLKRVDSVQEVLDSIALLLHTRLGERVHRPFTGSRLPDFKHEANSSTLRTVLAQELKQSIENGEPRVSSLTVDVSSNTTDERAVMIRLQFIVIPQNVPQNLVFPFFLNG